MMKTKLTPQVGTEIEIKVKISVSVSLTFHIVLFLTKIIRNVKALVVQNIFLNNPLFLYRAKASYLGPS